MHKGMTSQAERLAQVEGALEHERKVNLAAEQRLKEEYQSKIEQLRHV